MVSRMDSDDSRTTATMTAPAMLNKEVQKTPQIKTSQIKSNEKSLNEETLPAEQAKSMVIDMNKFLGSANSQLKFQFHDELNEYYVTVVDNTTNEVIREIPSKKLLDIHAAMREFVGLFVDRKI